MPLELEQALKRAGNLEPGTRQALANITSTGPDARTTLATALTAQWNAEHGLLDDLPDNDWEATQAVSQRILDMFEADAPDDDALDRALLRASYALGMAISDAGRPEPLMRAQPGPVERARILDLEPPPVAFLSLDDALAVPMSMALGMRLAGALQTSENFLPFARALLTYLRDEKGVGFDAESGTFSADAAAPNLETSAQALTARALDPAFPVRQGVQSAVREHLNDTERTRIAFETLYASGVQLTTDGELLSADSTAS